MESSVSTLVDNVAKENQEILIVVVKLTKVKWMMIVIGLIVFTQSIMMITLIILNYIKNILDERLIAFNVYGVLLINFADQHLENKFDLIVENNLAIIGFCLLSFRKSVRPTLSPRENFLFFF